MTRPYLPDLTGGLALGPAQTELLQRVGPYLAFEPRDTPVGEIALGSPWDDLVLDHLAAAYLLLPEAIYWDAEPLNAVALVSEVPRCDTCPRHMLICRAAKWDALVSYDGDVAYGYVCDPCADKYAIGIVGWPGTRLITTDAISNDVRDLVDAVTSELRRSNIW